jgi:hypothetical protein
MCTQRRPAIFCLFKFFFCLYTAKRRSGDGRSPLIRKNGSWDVRDIGCQRTNPRISFVTSTNHFLWHAIVRFHKKLKKDVGILFAGNPKMRRSMLKEIGKISFLFLTKIKTRDNSPKGVGNITRPFLLIKLNGDLATASAAACFKFMHLELVLEIDL